MQEFWVATAGPAVNVVIAAILFVGLAVIGGFTPPEKITVTSGSFWQRLMVLNIFLVAFNLLPAFPMDGGRVFAGVAIQAIGAPPRHGHRLSPRPQKRGSVKRRHIGRVSERGFPRDEIATQLGRNPAAIHTWFFNAKKAKRQDVKKVGEAKWQWVG